MKSGKLTTQELRENVLDKIERFRPEVLLSAALGEDCAALSIDDVILVSSDPITAVVETEKLGSLCVTVCCNDVAANGGEPVAMTLTIIMPVTCGAGDVGVIMDGAVKEAKRLNVEIVGGHTEFSDCVVRPIVSGTAIGKVKRVLKKTDLQPGDRLFVTKSLALEGTCILADIVKPALTEEEKRTLERFNSSLSVSRESVALSKLDSVSAMHDVTEGGVLGAALGAGLNLAIAFLVNFIYTFDWMKLGAKLAAMFNAMVSEIDWYSVGMLLWAKFKIALETLAGFLLNVDMKELAHAASQLIIGFFDSMSDTIQSIDWQALGHQIAEFLANIDWAGVADSFFEAIGSALGGLAAFLWGLIEDAWNSVVDWWHEVAYEDGKFTIKGLLNGIADALKSIGQWIKEHIFQPFIDGFKKAFGIASPSKVMAEQGGYIITGLLNGIKAGLQPIIDLFTMLKENAKKVLQGIIEFVSGVFTGDWEKAWNGIQEIFKGVWNGIVGLLEGAVNLIIDGVNWLISKLNMVSFTTPDWLDVIKPGLGGKTFGISIPNIERVALPRLATGAVIPPNREFLAVLGDQKRGTNVEAPADLIRQMVREELRAYGGGIGNRQQTVILQVDHREFGRVVYQLNNEETQRVGVRLAGAKA